jgi:hypothetical protein
VASLEVDNNKNIENNQVSFKPPKHFFGAFNGYKNKNKQKNEKLWVVLIRHLLFNKTTRFFYQTNDK